MLLAQDVEDALMIYISCGIVTYIFSNIQLRTSFTLQRFMYVFKRR